uniref:NADH-ubiquinone oxidoreductase chain 2 n=1 Tax=Ixodes nuttallianus TaxID=213687 RepID=A0A976MYL1_9ACAR|nr:NADH dehydrogenase subunit 2 [Ixodes nuttallianus]UNO53780.1 NADH dehydrogenase subunit 2 [Ixodes nuttallianus]
MFYQMMILSWALLSSILMGISSSYWFPMWMSLEINMMMFIPMMNSKNFLSSNSMMNYYIIQSFSSSLFLLSSLLLSILPNNMLIFMILISMMIKLGVAPFHSWFTQISEGLNFFPFFTLLTFQKIIPLFIISIYNHIFMIPFIVLSSVMGSLSGLNYTSMKKILAFSSVSHLSWMMSLIITNQDFWILYLLIYTLILMKISLSFSNNLILTINNLNSKKETLLNKISMISLFLSLGGLPPFLGFLMKWISVILIMKNLPMILFILIPSSLINLFFYTRAVYPSLMKLNIFMKPFQIFNNLKLNWSFLLNFLVIVILAPTILIV